jgi:magnesium transporter
VDRELARPCRHHCGDEPADSGNRLNLITKKVTSWAAIIAVPNAITGFYGQDLPYLGFSHASEFITSSVLIVTLSCGRYVAFERRDWL